MASLGTLAWAERTGGELSVRARVKEMGAATVEQVKLLSGPLRRRLALGSDRVRHLDLPARAPDSRAAREAEALCRELSSTALHQHCLRSWLFANLLAQRDRRRFDAELLYVICLLHDLGLTERHFEQEPRARCFAVEGAWAARDLLRRVGWEEPRAEVVAEAICMHINVRLPNEATAEARLLAAGAGLDVLGRGYGSLERSDVHAVVERHPRLELKQEIAQWMGREAAARPRGRIGLLWRLGLERRIRAAPFSS